MTSNDSSSSGSADIAKPRRLDYVRLSNITFAPRNPKGHDEEGISRSIAHHGLGELPLVDQRTGRLVAGHGRVGELRAMQNAAEQPPDGVLLDQDGEWLVPVVTGWASRSDADAEAYLVGSNQLTMAGSWDFGDLAGVLQDLRDAELDTLTGFDADAIDTILREALPPNNPPPQSGDAPIDDEHPRLFDVIIECDTEEQQVTLLEKFSEEGLTCRALL